MKTKMLFNLTFLVFLFFANSAFAITREVTIKNMLPGQINLVSYSGEFTPAPPQQILSNGSANLVGTWLFLRNTDRHAVYSYSFVKNGTKYEGKCDIGLYISGGGKLSCSSKGCTGPVDIRPGGYNSNGDPIGLIQYIGS